MAFGAISGQFVHGLKKMQTLMKFGLLSLGANGPYSPGLGSCAGVIPANVVVKVWVHMQRMQPQARHTHCTAGLHKLAESK